MNAGNQDGSYPRPQLVRSQYIALDGECGFAFDDGDVGLAERWPSRTDVFTSTITLPFSPESSASGIGDLGFHRIAWYRRALTADDLAGAGLGTQGDRVILHFGAVDHSADVWVDGRFVGRHVGGQTAFQFDVTAALAITGLEPGSEHTIVVRAEDDPLDVSIPRGKQDWHEQPHSIWYHRITGIWRTVWIEVVPRLHITSLTWTPDVLHACVRAEIELSERPVGALTVSVELEGLARMTIDTDSDRILLDIPIAVLRNGQAMDEVLWSPEHPHLVDARITVGEDSVESYIGLRSVAVAHGRLMLNDRPFYLRSVLQQGYWPDSHFTPPSVEAMRAEIELTKRLGFNSIRIHQKVEDPRYLYWCDRLGLTVWGEAAAAYEFSPRAVELYAAEWARVVRSQVSHPSLIVWVPFNESWGIQHVAHDPAQRAYSLALTQLTRALDPSRPVISNDGWEHTDSDIMTVHDYEPSGEVIRERFGGPALPALGGPGRRLSLGGPTDAPVMLTEFGGVRLGEDGLSWGYQTATSADEFRDRIGSIVLAVLASPLLAGFCYTQLTDTGQETNGLCDQNRVPKLPEETVRAMITGSHP